MKEQAEKNNLQERWNTAKNRIFNAYAQKPTKQIFIWSRIPGEIWEKSDVEILEGLADYAEFCVNTFIAVEHDIDPDLYRSDAYLLKIFSVNRQLRKRSLIIQSQCCYCGSKEGTMYKWSTSSNRAIDEDVPMDIYVCPSNERCAEKAHTGGYIINRQYRWRKVDELFAQSKTQREMADILHVSVSTIQKDLRNLKQTTETICPHCGGNVKARFSDLFQYGGEIKCKHCEGNVHVSFYK